MPLLDRIGHFSPSALRLFRNAPVAWVCRYLYDMRDDGGPKAWRGKAVEAAMDAILFSQADDSAALAAAFTAFEADAKGEATEEIDLERNAITDYVRQAATLFRALPSKPLVRQARIERRFEGIDIPIIGYADWLFEDDTALDLKTTSALPSKPRPDDVYQVAFYRDAAALAYVTPKKAALYTIAPEDIEAARAELVRSARSLQYALRLFNSREQMLRVYPMAADSYLLSPELRTQIARLMEIGNERFVPSL